MRLLIIRNISQNSVGVCGKSLKPGHTLGMPLALVQGNKSYNDYTVTGIRGYSDQLATLVSAGKIVVSLNGIVLTAAQVSTLDAPISADLIKEDWQDSVLTRTNTPPATPALGARYIVTSVATGAWVGKETAIAQWNGAHWDFTMPTVGTTLLVEDVSTFYYFDGAAWGGWGASVTHASLAGVTANQHHAQAHVLNGADHTVSGLTTGHVLQATGATTFGFAALSTQFKRETISFVVPGAISAATEQGGAWFAPAAGAIVAAYAYRKSTTESAGGTTIDINIGGTTIFTTQSNRPFIAYDDADGMAKVTTIEAGTLAADNKVTVDVDSIDVSGAPSDLTVELVVEYSA
jgi:hypothetical protein